MRKLIALTFAALAAVSAIAASVAGADSTRVASPAIANCKKSLIALTGPYTGPAGTAGLDQRNWGRVFITNWNAGKAIPGVPKGFKRTKLKALEADTALNPQLAATVAVQLRSNKDLLASAASPAEVVAVARSCDAAGSRSCRVRPRGLASPIRRLRTAAS
jgi:hypothetical protein